MKKRNLAGIGAASVLGLALLIQPGLSTTAFAAQGAATATAPQQIQGRIVNVTFDEHCIDAAGTPVCTFDIKGIGISDQGELIERSIVGTAHGTVETPGEVAVYWSYALWTYPDGSTMLLHSAGKGAIEADGQHTYAGTQTCIEGSGRFADVDCTIDWSHSAQPNGLYAGSYSGTVTPKGQS